MKKLQGMLKLALAGTLAMCVLAGCGGEASSAVPSAGQAASTDASIPSQPAGQEGFVFAYAGNTVAMGENMADVLARIGEPTDVFEAPSCAFEGVDKIYYYPGFQVNTYPDGEEDYVLSLTLTDDSVTTSEGVYIGMSADEVITRYGESSSANEKQLIYQKGNTELIFLMEGDEVADITYYNTLV